MHCIAVVVKKYYLLGRNIDKKLGRAVVGATVFPLFTINELLQSYNVLDTILTAAGQRKQIILCSKVLCWSNATG